MTIQTAMELLSKMHLAVAIISVVAGLLLVTSLVLFRLWDLEKARNIHRQTFIQSLLRKALMDRRHVVRCETDKLEKVFDTKVRTLPDPKQFNSKPGRHPATERKVRRGNGG